MRGVQVLAVVVILLGPTVAPSGAQTITTFDNSGARVGLRVGYAGHGPDWDTSIDSPLLGDLVRVRGSVGRGRWQSEFDSYPDPTVTRLAASALVFPHSYYDLKPYFGLGISAYVPRGVELSTRTGKRLIGGVEGSGERWTVGVEVEIDLPRLVDVEDRPLVDDNLYLTGRIGLAVRRRF